MKVAVPRMNDSMFAKLGNGAHTISITSTLVFAFLVARYAANENDNFIFDEQWMRDGFCVTNADIPYWNSHDLCLYVDSAAAVLLFSLFLVLRKTPGLERANEILVMGIIGMLAHGIGHGAIGKTMRERQREDGFDSSNNQERTIDMLRSMPSSETLRSLAVTILFWLGLIRSTSPNLSYKAVAILSLLSMAGQMFIPKYFGFTYVQTILILIHSFNELNRKKKEKDFVYATYALSLSLPITFVGWVESTQCSTFVKDTFYGHLAYDGFIPIGLLTWYLACYFRVTMDMKPPGKKEKNL